MSIQRIDSKNTHGWQARAYVEAPTRCRPVRLTKFISDSAAGGKRKARRLAEWHERRLKAAARRMRDE
jgi:hypothetical protein